MGVPGLTTFLDENNWLLKDFKLHHTSLIIDGNNLYHFLYYYFQVNHAYGGDYDKFFEKCAFFFNSLAECNVRPYVVFDGAYDRSGMKLKTALKRAKDRIALAGSISRGGRGKILPILAHETFHKVLKALSIPYVTYYFEADHQIAALAIKWNCPVLTNDSDFFIYDIPAGVILLDYLNLKLVKNADDSEDCCHMNTQMYYIAGVMKAMHTKDCNFVALFATLLGNDVVDGRQFDPFFARARLPKRSSQFRSVKSNPKIGGLLGWFQSHHDFSSALSVIISYFPVDKQETIKKTILNSVNGYTDLNCELEDGFRDNFILTPVESFAGNNLPAWFLHAVQKGEVPVRALNAVTLRRVIVLAQVEMMSEPSAYQCSLPIRCFLYTCLLSVDVDSENALESFSINEYDREWKNLKSKAIKPLCFLRNGGRVPRLDEIPILGVEERQRILLDVLNLRLNDLMEFPFDSQLLVAVIVYWICNANPKVSTLHLEALLVCCLKLGILTNAFSIFARNCGTPLEDDCCILSDEILSKLETFAGNPHHNHAVTFDGSVIHAFSQFQSCLEAVIYANQLLLLPFPPIDPSKVFNGTFLYSFYRELRNRKNPELYTVELLCRSSATAVAFVHCRTVIKSLLPNESFFDVGQGKGFKGKRQKKKKKEVNKKDDDEPETKELGSNDEFVVGCDLDNKFSCLDIDVH